MTITYPEIVDISVGQTPLKKAPSDKQKQLTVDKQRQYDYPVATVEQIIEKAQIEAIEARNNPFVFEKPIKRVAVIGAGPSGLPTAKALKEHGLEVKVFERLDDIGGTWVYSEEAPLKPPIPCVAHFTQGKEAVLEKPELIEDTHEERARHAPPTACYAELHNNTPAPIMMDFEDFPWPKGSPWYVSHTRIHQYYKDYAVEYGLYDLLELNTSVEYMERIIKKEDDGDKSEWRLTLRKATKVIQGDTEKSMIQYKTWTETFDAVAVASGAFQNPFVPDIKDLGEYNTRWPERVMHSKQYRRHQDFVGKNVLVVGANASGIDVAFHLSEVVRSLYLVIRSEDVQPASLRCLLRSTIPDTAIRKSGIRAFSNSDGTVNGSITFEDGTVVHDIDQVIFCTGFINDYKFLGPLRAYAQRSEEADIKKEKQEKNDVIAASQEEDGSIDKKEQEEALVKIDGKRVLDTYQGIFLVRDPTLAFVGVPGYTISASFFYYQGQSIARVWSGSAWLPSQEKMQELVDASICPFPPSDINLLTGVLHSQRLVTWLNDHANYIGCKRENDRKDKLYTYKGIDPAVTELWGLIEESWPHRTFYILRCLRDSDKK